MYVPHGAKVIMSQIVVVDTGGQYCHLIARRVREAGVRAEICAPDQVLTRSAHSKGVIISGGPKSVYADDAIRCPPEIFHGAIPVLGICYGHQLMAYELGGDIRAGEAREFGEARLRIVAEDTILRGVQSNEVVWMSHGDEVVSPPPKFQVLGNTEHCRVAAMVDSRRRKFGLQFHPEVAHTASGDRILKNFLFDVCRCESDWNIASQVIALQQRIRSEVGKRKVLFFVSGGVDSTVAFALCAETLGPRQVAGVFVDTGFMRKGERQQIRAAFAERGWNNIQCLDKRDEFFRRLEKEEVFDPEAKRLLIGNAFLDVQREVCAGLDLLSDGWIFGQGTIYPDTIESGGTKNAAVIKTHQNRVPAIAKLIEQGLVLEPLAAFYKDEVRKIGRELDLPEEMVSKHPFPGPGLAVRCLCSNSKRDVETSVEAEEILAPAHRAVSIPLRSVGVQGDYRSYSKVVVLTGDLDLDVLGRAATALTNRLPTVNRVATLLKTSTGAGIESAHVRPAYIDTHRINLLREADAIANGILKDRGCAGEVWQFPVVLLPLTFEGGETVALRPVTSTDAMTARFAHLEGSVIDQIADEVLKLAGIDAVLYDITNKPPATIEWE